MKMAQRNLIAQLTHSPKIGARAFGIFHERGIVIKREIPDGPTEAAVWKISSSSVSPRDPTFATSPRHYLN